MDENRALKAPSPANDDHHTNTWGCSVSQHQHVPTVTVNNGVRMPILGFGVSQIPPGQTEPAVTAALQAGYRHIDTAAAYANEEAVGRAIEKSGIPREDLFVTTKVNGPTEPQRSWTGDPPTVNAGGD